MGQVLYFAIDLGFMPSKRQDRTQITYKLTSIQALSSPAQMLSFRKARSSYMDPLQSLVTW